MWGALWWDKDFYRCLTILWGTFLRMTWIAYLHFTDWLWPFLLIRTLFWYLIRVCLAFLPFGVLDRFGSSWEVPFWILHHLFLWSWCQITLISKFLWIFDFPRLIVVSWCFSFALDLLKIVHTVLWGVFFVVTFAFKFGFLCFEVKQSVFQVFHVRYS